MMQRSMLVSVIVGAVLVSSDVGVTELTAKESQFFVLRKDKAKDPREGKKGRVIGIVTGKKVTSRGAYIEVKAFGEAKERKYFPHWRGGAPSKGGGLDKKTIAIFKKLKVGSRVELKWTFEERLRVDTLKVLSPPKKEE